MIEFKADANCPSCGAPNKGTASCHRCCLPLTEAEKIHQQQQRREEIEQIIQERVDEAMQGIVQTLKSTKTLKGLAVALAKEMREDREDRAK